MKVTVTKDANALARQVWVFRLDFFSSGNFASLRLTQWADERRPTEGHKWQPVLQWYDRNALFGRGFCHRISEPPVPEDVIASAREQLCDAVRSAPVQLPESP